MMQRYEPIRGMYICVEGGSYVLYSDHLAVVAEKNKEYQTLLSHHEEQMGDSMGKITCLKTTLAEKDAEITAKDNQIAQAGMIVDAIDMILSNGEEPSDFEMSFPLVRAVWDRHEKCMAHEAEITTLKKRVREPEAQAYVTSENYTANSTELRIAELRNRDNVANIAKGTL